MWALFYQVPEPRRRRRAQLHRRPHAGCRLHRQLGGATHLTLYAYTHTSVHTSMHASMRTYASITPLCTSLSTPVYRRSHARRSLHRQLGGAARHSRHTYIHTLCTTSFIHTSIGASERITSLYRRPHARRLIVIWETRTPLLPPSSLVIFLLLSRHSFLLQVGLSLSQLSCAPGTRSSPLRTAPFSLPVPLFSRQARSLSVKDSVLLLVWTPFSFLLQVGVSATIACLAHEVPHEIGDVAVLMQAHIVV